MLRRNARSGSPGRSPPSPLACYRFGRGCRGAWRRSRRSSPSSSASIMRPASSTSSPPCERVRPPMARRSRATSWASTCALARAMRGPRRKRTSSTVSLLSDGPEQNRFAAVLPRLEPREPAGRLRPHRHRRSRIKTISLLGPNLASVRFLRETRKGDETTHLALDRHHHLRGAARRQGLDQRPAREPDRLSGLRVPRRSGGAAVSRASPALRAVLAVLTLCPHGTPRLRPAAARRPAFAMPACPPLSSTTRSTSSRSTA